MTNAIDPALSTASSSSSTSSSKKAKSSGSGTFIATGLPVVVNVQHSDSGYNNKIYWSTDNFKTKHYIAIDNHVGNYNIGTFAEGTKIEFGIDNGNGEFYQTGAVAADRIMHAKVSKTATSTTIGFEDLYGGGDFDFNDVLISVQNSTAKSSSSSTAAGGGSGGSIYPDRTEATGTGAMQWPWFIDNTGKVSDYWPGHANSSSLSINDLLKKLTGIVDITKVNISLSTSNTLLHITKVKVKEEPNVPVNNEKKDEVKVPVDNENPGDAKKITYFNVPDLNLTPTKTNQNSFPAKEFISGPEPIPAEDGSHSTLASELNAGTILNVTNSDAVYKVGKPYDEPTKAGDLDTATTVDVKLLNAIYRQMG